MAKLFFYPDSAKSTMAVFRFLKKAGIEHEIREQESKIEITGNTEFVNQCQKELEFSIADKQFTGKLERYGN